MTDLPKGVVRPSSQAQEAEIEYLKGLLARVEPLLSNAEAKQSQHAADWARDAYHLINDIKREGELTEPRIIVSRQAMDNLKARSPGHGIRAGLFENIGGRLYTRTFSCL